jgi:hypothetical protein
VCGLRRFVRTAGGALVCSGCGSAHHVQFLETQENEEAAAVHGVGRRIKTRRAGSARFAELSEARAAASALPPDVGAKLMTVCLTEMTRQWAAVLQDHPEAIVTLDSDHARSVSASKAMLRAWPLVVAAVSSAENAVRLAGRDVVPTAVSRFAGRQAAALPGAEQQPGERESDSGQTDRLPLSPRLVMALAAWSMRLAGCAEAETALCRAAHDGVVPWTSAWLCLPLGLRECAPMCASALMSLRGPSPASVLRLASKIATVTTWGLQPLPAPLGVRAAAMPVSLTEPWVDAAVSLMPDVHAPAPASATSKRARAAPSTSPEGRLPPSGGTFHACGAVLVALLARHALDEDGNLVINIPTQRASSTPARTLASAASSLVGGITGLGQLVAVAALAMPPGDADSLPPAFKLALKSAGAPSANAATTPRVQSGGSTPPRLSAAGPRMGSAPTQWSLKSWALQQAGDGQATRGILAQAAQAPLLQAQRSLATWALRSRSAASALPAASPLQAADAASGAHVQVLAQRTLQVLAQRTLQVLAQRTLQVLLNLRSLSTAPAAVDRALAMLQSDCTLSSALDSLARHCWGAPRAVVEAAVEVLTSAAQRVRSGSRRRDVFTACIWAAAAAAADRRKPSSAE